jgi:polyisoprenoid-binding protein YceI
MTRWIFEPGHTAAWFRARHMMVTHVRGGFTGIRGEIDFDPADPSRGTVSAEIDARTLWTGETDRDAHLKSEDFLHVEAHPTIRYRGDRVEPLGCNDFRVLGELTLRGVTRDVPLEVRYLGSWETPYWDGGEDKGPIRRLGFVATAVIDRHDFGVSWNGELDRGGVVVGSTIWITLDVEALEQGIVPGL